ncbi:LytTR family transcriptional regulator DNA-binding domain-containing protein [Enterococcus sp. LJL90]
MNVFIIDDQFTIRNKIKDTVEELASPTILITEIAIVQEFYNGLPNMIIEDDDFFFLDIDLKTYFTGIDLAEQIRLKNQQCFIVFITDFESKGLEVLNKQIFPLGFLLKSQERSLFKATVKNILQKAGMISQKRQKKRHILVFNNFESDILLPESNIFYIATVPGFKQMLIVKHLQGECMVQEKLNSVKGKIHSEYYFKELKSFIINLNLVQRISISEGSVQFVDGSYLEIGKAGARKTKNYLKGLGIGEF